MKVIGAKIKTVLTREGEPFFGPGVMELLEGIAREGSVAESARSMGLSYSKAWKMLHESERGFGFPLVKRSTGGKGGGGAVLTEDGLKVLESYSILSSDISSYAERRLGELFHV